ncbi:MAG: indole-3-glycerol phosphate synthase TrpC [Candidatus Eremiobacteraeota bacterium]|nr:indole-3-glycerol phosphate synthase TrpC [Candidatus Eremiobacteraeota bacterium]MBC5826671.1 indole-3-glycerol phosphate synthase TrpC [Candidatus Eremiobacteraeota bacterium]
MTYLDRIMSGRRLDIAREKSRVPQRELAERAAARDDARDFLGAICSGSPSIIAEIKRASPSAGAILGTYDPPGIAGAYERGGAAALSVLTEPRYFGGALSHLRAARASTSLPVLCKDFVFDEYQVWAAACAGADAVLLIVAVLSDDQLPLLLSAAAAANMAALVEIHDESEGARALAAGARIIGINNRDLGSLEVDLTVALRVRRTLPDWVVAVAESGYRTADEIGACAIAGFRAVLIGEALLRDREPGDAVSRLRGVAK